MLKAPCCLQSGCLAISAVDTELTCSHACECMQMQMHVCEHSIFVPVLLLLILLCIAKLQRGDFVPRVSSGSSQSSRDNQSQGKMMQGSSSSSDADTARHSSSTAASQRAGRFGGEVGQSSDVEGQSSIGSEQISRKTGQRAEEAGQASNSASCSSKHIGQSGSGIGQSGSSIGQSGSGIGRYGSRPEQSAPQLHLRESIQGLLNPKQHSVQASRLAFPLLSLKVIDSMGLQNQWGGGVPYSQPNLVSAQLTYHCLPVQLDLALLG